MLKVKINSLLDYIQPTKYIVSSEEYSNEFNTPVLTAGDTFLLGYTNDKDGIYNASKHNPIILFDDFTTAIKWVDFPFKVKSSACKIIVSKTKTNLRYCYYAMKAMNFDHLQHKRYWISEYSEQLINDYEDENSKIVAELDNITDTISKKEQVILNLDELIKSRFIEMFGDPINNDLNLPLKKLSEICKLKSGKAIVTGELIDKKTDNLYPCFGGNGIRGYINRYSHEGTLPIIGRQGALAGNVNLAKGKFYATEHAVVANPIVPMNTIWCFYGLQMLKLERFQSGAAQPGLAVEKINVVKIPFPEKTKQDSFGKFVEQVDKSKFIVQKEIKDLQELLDKKMDEYFGQ